jgi:hypothetical protein
MQKGKKKLETIFTMVKEEGFVHLSIRVFSYGDRFYYGFDYETDDGDKSYQSPSLGNSFWFTSVHAAFIRAVKNVENHFLGNFRLKKAYGHYNKLTQLSLVN